VERIPLNFSVNGRQHSLSVDVDATLLDTLRERLGLTGTKKGCDHGQCGACTVLVDGRRINACLTLAVMHDGHAITTIEGLANGAALHPLQQAFITRDAFQCGYCTPGQICSALGMINEGHVGTPDARPAPEDALRDVVREFMSGNLCRCGAYTNIVDAIMDVLHQQEQERP
jgi:xanthine dehydrogenase YagT iron-sulfur-binding subunit